MNERLHMVTRYVTGIAHHGATPNEYRRDCEERPHVKASPLLTGVLGAGPRQPWPDDSIGSRALWVLSAFGPHPLEGAEVFGPHANEAVVFEDVADFVFTQ